MELKEGYLNTEIGVLPNDWAIKRLGDIGKFSKGEGVRKDEALSGDLPCVRYGELYTRHNDYIKHFYSFISRNVAVTAKKISYGDILFAGSGETKAEIGKSVAVCTDVECYAGSDIVILTPTNYSPYFLGFLLNAPFIQKQKANRGQGDAVVHISATQLSNILFPSPKLSEQVAIAQAILNVDSLIQNIAKMIVKKRNIKLGAIQKLLVVKDNWAVIKLKEIGECIIGLTYSPLNVKDNGTLVLRSSNVQDSSLRYEDNVYVDMKIPDKLINKESDILICVRNGSRNLIGKCALIKGMAVGETFGAFMAVYRSPYNEFIYHVFQSEIIKRQIDEHLGATINQITNKSLNSFQIPFPPPDERTRISKILSDMEDEIVALKQKLAKYQNIKQGMMQNLLTGKIRLV